ncbi:MAG TPA: ABC transporter substrate-binding protein [Candidatus Riflebacteria bacterium]|nr:ABC transporter substrate-binding protein [Candidatus Riflebacteria bacterium]
MDRQSFQHFPVVELQSQGQHSTHRKRKPVQSGGKIMQCQCYENNEMQDTSILPSNHFADKINTEQKTRMSRRKHQFLAVVMMIAIVMIAFVSGCGSSEPEVIIYTSVDQPFAEPVFKAFTDKTGIRVRPVFDTEAAKTVGLANRLRAESAAPRADVFWSSEFSHTIRLAAEGIFAPYRPAHAEDIPAHFRDAQDLWTGSGQRARVLIVNKNRLHVDDWPKSLAELFDTNWAPGQVTVARPLFGTTNTHASAIFAREGEEGLRSFFEKLQQRHAAFVDGNATTRDRVVAGTSFVGLTDSDDAVVAIKRGDPVAMIFPDQGENQAGTLLIPNTAALVKNGPNSTQAKTFLDFITSAEGELLLTRLGEGFFPIRKDLAPQLEWLPANGVKELQISLPQVAGAIASTSAILNEMFLQ